MTSTLSRKQFAAFSAARSAPLGIGAQEYWAYHQARLWDSYKRAARLLPDRGTFVSAGAGPAYVEAALVRSHAARGTVVDFPQTLDEYTDLYAEAGFKAHAVNLTQPTHLGSLIGTGFDLALSLEVVEHLPIPPRVHLASIAEVLRPAGALLLSTPNAGSLRWVLKTLLHQPTLPPPEQTFAEVGYDNEGVHRREYMRSEIVDAFQRCGMTVSGTAWVSYGRHNRRDLILLSVEQLIPPLRQTMTITGIAPDDKH